MIQSRCRLGFDSKPLDVIFCGKLPTQDHFQSHGAIKLQIAGSVGGSVSSSLGDLFWSLSDIDVHFTQELFYAGTVPVSVKVDILSGTRRVLCADARGKPLRLPDEDGS